MPLTPTEKLAGRHFRAVRQAALDELNAARPPGMDVLVFWRVARHECADGTSVGISLREHYELSEAYRVCDAGECASAPHVSRHGAKVASRDGQFAFVWKEGKCSGCGLVVRTSLGRFVIAADHPPGNGRAHGGQAGAHSGDPRQPRA